MELDVNELFYKIEDKNLEYEEGFDNDDIYLKQSLLFQRVRGIS